MLKRVFVAAAIIIASPALVSAQDIFFSFSDSALETTTVAPAGTVTGTAFVFSDGQFGFDAIDLTLLSSDRNVLNITGGTATNPTFNLVGGTRFNSSVVDIDPNSIDPVTNPSGDFRLFSVNVTENGVNPGLSALGDPDFDANIGPNGAVLLASVDFEVVGPGDATLGFALGEQGALTLPDVILDPSFGTASFTAEAAEVVPEPSSIALLLLGSVGLVSRRKRS